MRVYVIYTFANIALHLYIEPVFLSMLFNILSSFLGVHLAYCFSSYQVYHLRLNVPKQSKICLSIIVLHESKHHLPAHFLCFFCHCKGGNVLRPNRINVMTIVSNVIRNFPHLHFCFHYTVTSVLLLLSILLRIKSVAFCAAAPAYTTIFLYCLIAFIL